MHDQGSTPGDQKRCTKCGETKPLDVFYLRPETGGYRSKCRACYADRSDAQRERARASKRTHYLANRERLLAQQNAYSAANREREAARCRAWRAANPDRVKALNVRYYDANRESLLEWARRHHADHPEIARTINRRRKARMRGARIRPFKASDWQITLDGFNGRCAYCLQPMGEVTMDHMTPVVRGGEHAIENVVPACMRCNIWKYDRTLLEFLGMQQKGLTSRGHYLTPRSARATTS